MFTKEEILRNSYKVFTQYQVVYEVWIKTSYQLWEVNQDILRALIRSPKKKYSGKEEDKKSTNKPFYLENDFNQAIQNCVNLSIDRFLCFSELMGQCTQVAQKIWGISGAGREKL